MRESAPPTLQRKLTDTSRSTTIPLYTCPKLLDGRFAELGATRVYPLGCADDATGLEDVVRPWRAGLVPALKLAMNMAMKGSDETGAGEAKGSEVSNKAVPWPLYDHSALEESLQPLRGLWG